MSKKFEQIGRISAAVIALPEDHLGIALDVLNKLSDPNWKVRMSEVLRQGLKPVAKAVETLLENMGSVTVVIDTTVNPSEVLKTTEATTKIEGLWINDNAFAQILAKAKGTAPTSVTMELRRLKVGANDCMIKNELPKEHEIDPTAFVHMLATELTKVRSGETSKVLSKDCWRLFYVAGLVVYVHWRSGDSEWSVYVWKLGGRTWFAKYVVLSCN